MDLSGLEGLTPVALTTTSPSNVVTATTPQGSGIPIRTGTPVFGLNIPSTSLLGRTSTNQFGQASPLNIRGLQPLETKPEVPHHSVEELTELIRTAFEDPPMISFDHETMDKWEVPNLICNTCQTSLPPILHLLYRAMIRGDITDVNQRIKLVKVLGLSPDNQATLLNPERYGPEAKLKLISVYGLPPSEINNLQPGMISSPFALKIIKKIFGIDQICCNGQIMFPLRMVLGEAIDPEFMQRLHNQIRIISGYYDNRPIGPTFDSVIAIDRPSVIPGIYMDTNPSNDPFVFLRKHNFFTFKQNPSLNPINWINANLS